MTSVGAPGQAETRSALDAQRFRRSDEETAVGRAVGRAVPDPRFETAHMVGEVGGASNA
ncbi:hypothetical protein ABZ470_04790 [Streptosporangium sp. NPDC020072]|uniref:hypothetical protein n=1 Tax=Streptosporangium sp. NPDC020072 TaxID=3154788 RepID=UPI00342D2FA6